MDRSSRQLFNRWDTGPITAALNQRLPGRSPTSQRSALLTEDISRPSMMSEVKPFLDAIGRARSAVSQFESRNPFSDTTRVGSVRSSLSNPFSRGVSRSQAASANPFGSSGWSGRPALSSNLQSSNPYNRGAIRNSPQVEAHKAAMMARGPAQAPGDPGAGGSMGNPTGGNWENVNRWNGQIQSAIDRVAREFGITVPANIVKAVMELESGGNMVGCNNSGYCGLMQTGPGSNISNYNHAYNMTPEGNLYYGVQELANWYKATGSWEDAPIAYFSGYNYNKPWVSDGHYTVADYRAHIARNLAALNGAGQSSWGGGGGGGGLSTMFPGRTSGFDFGVSSSNGLYGYGTAYGLDGTQHTGLDVMMPMYTPIYAPANARVVCVGCWRNDHLGGGVGRIELEMPDGARILYDHSNSATVQVGQMVQAGQMIGRSGGMYSPHIHLEVRVPDGSQSSGYRLVDPAAYFGGMVGGGGGGGGAVTGGYVSPQDRIRQLLGRL